MDDTYVVFSNENAFGFYVHSLNLLHPFVFTLFLKKDVKWLSLFCKCLLKKTFQVYHLHLPETHIHRWIPTLEFYCPQKRKTFAKTSITAICGQKEFVYNLKIVH